MSGPAGADGPSPIHLVLAEAELELVPEALHDHRQVLAHADRQGLSPAGLVLDASDHHAALRTASDRGALDDVDRRGRPDIVHLWLLTVLESRACKAGHIRPWVHTRHDVLVEIDPETRLVKHYPRFLGLVRQLLAEGRVGPTDKTLLSARDGVPLAEVLEARPDPVVVLDDTGESTPPATIADRVAGPDAGGGTLVVGGFPSGTFRAADALEGRPRLALPGGPLVAWAATGEVLAHVAARRVDGAR